MMHSELWLLADAGQPLRQVVARPSLYIRLYSLTCRPLRLSGFLIYCECERVNAWIDGC
jgi:hypothetical protein